MVQANNPDDLLGPQGATNYLNLQAGSKVKLNNGAIAEIIANPTDGAWLFVRFLEHPENPSQIGEEEMVFFVDVQAVV